MSNIELELWVDDECVVGASGPREDAFAEIRHYWGQYAGDGTCSVYEVTRKLIPMDIVHGFVEETTKAPEPAPAGCEAWWHLKQYGYAPGGYSMKCPHCKVTVLDVDKRARCCKPCAIAFYECDQHSAVNRSDAL
jgi:hypothetical protein